MAVPAPGDMRTYIGDALEGQQDGHMLPWIVRDSASGAVIGSTRYHDIVAGIDRVEIEAHLSTRTAASGRMSIRPASCSCSLTRSTHSGAKWWACERTRSIFDRSGRLKPWAQKGTASYATMAPGVMEAPRRRDVQHPLERVARRAAASRAAGCTGIGEQIGFLPPRRSGIWSVGNALDQVGAEAEPLAVRRRWRVRLSHLQ